MKIFDNKRYKNGFCFLVAIVLRATMVLFVGSVKNNREKYILRKRNAS
jgi:hypothetical protein